MEIPVICVRSTLLPAEEARVDRKPVFDLTNLHQSEYVHQLRFHGETNIHLFIILSFPILSFPAFYLTFFFIISYSPYTFFLHYIILFSFAISYFFNSFYHTFLHYITLFSFILLTFFLRHIILF